MKKVMKKFNRALSIMLVAAMVLTMAPQTAMPVLAAEPGTEADIDVPQVVDEEPVVEEVVETPETGNEEVPEGDNQPPVIEEENDSTETPSTEGETSDEGGEIVDPTIPEEDSSFDNITTNDVTPQANELAAPVITLKKGDDTIESGATVTNRAADVKFEIAAVDGVTFKYTLDGTDPTKDTGTAYGTEAATVPAPDQNTEGTVTIKAIAYKAASSEEGGAPEQISAVASATVVFAAKKNTVKLAAASEEGATIKVGDTALTKTEGVELDPTKDLSLTVEVVGEAAKTKEISQVQYRDVTSTGDTGWTPVGATENGTYTIPKDALESLTNDIEIKATLKDMPKVTFALGADSKYDMFTVKLTVKKGSAILKNAEVLKLTDADKAVYIPSDTAVTVAIEANKKCQLTKVTLGETDVPITSKAKATVTVSNKFETDATITVTATEEYLKAKVEPQTGGTGEASETTAKIWSVAPRAKYVISGLKGAGGEFAIGKAVLEKSVNGVTLTELTEAGTATTAEGDDENPTTPDPTPATPTGKYLLDVTEDAGGAQVKVKLYATKDDTTPVDTITVNVASVIKAVTGIGSAKKDADKTFSVNQTIGTEASYVLTLDTKTSKDELAVKVKADGGNTSGLIKTDVNDLKIEKDAKGNQTLKVATNVVEVKDNTTAVVEIVNNSSETKPVVGTLTIKAAKPAWDGKETPTVKLTGSTDVELNLALTLPESVNKTAPEGTEYYYKVTPTVQPATKKSGYTYIEDTQYVKVTDVTTHKSLKVIDKDFGKGTDAKFDVTVQLVQYKPTTTPPESGDQGGGGTTNPPAGDNQGGDNQGDGDNQSGTTAASVGDVSVYATGDESDTPTTPTTPSTGEPGIVIASSKAVIVKGLATKTPYYADKISLKKTKAASNLYTGQTAAVATVDFGKNTTYNRDEDVEAWVEGNKGNTSADGKISVVPNEAEVTRSGDPLTVVNGQVTLKVGKDVTPGKYTICVEQIPNKGIPDDAIQAKATLQVTVVQGIKTIEAQSVPKIYVAASKAGSAKITPVYNEGVKEKKPKTAKVIYTLGTKADDGSLTPANTTLNEWVTVKNNGTVTVKRGYTTGKITDDKFAVKVSAADFTENDAADIVEFQISTAELKLGKIVLVEKKTENGNTTYKNLDITKAIPKEKVAGGAAEIHVLKSEVTKTDDFVEDDFVEDSLYALTFSKKSDIGIGNDGNIWVKKPVDKVKVSAMTTDGNKKKATDLVFSVTYETADNVKLQYCLAATQNYSDFTSGAASVTGPTSEVIHVIAVKAAQNGGVTTLNNCLVDYKVSVSGAKIVNNYGDKNNLCIDIVMNKKEAVLKLTNQKGKNPVEYKITNANFDMKKAPKVTLAKGTTFYAKYDAEQTLTFNVDKWVEKNNGASAAVKYIKVTAAPDEASKALYQLIKEESNKTIEFEPSTTAATPIRIPFKSTEDVAGIKNGILRFDFVDENGAVVTQTSADVKISTTLLKKSYKLTNKYNMSEKDAAHVKLVASGKPAGVAKKTDSEELDVTFNHILNANIKGEVNHFIEAFSLDSTTGVLSLIDKYKAVKDYGKAGKYKGVNNLIGFVNYTVNYEDGTHDIFTTQITVNIDVAKKATINNLKATAKPVMTAADMAPEIAVATGRKVPVKLVYAEYKDKTGTTFEVNKSVVYKDGTVILKLAEGASAPAAGKLEGTLTVIPEDSMYADKVEETYNAAHPSDGSSVDAEKKKAWDDLFTAAQIPLSVKIEVKAITTPNKVKVESKDGKPSFKDVVESSGTYTVKVPYTVAISAGVSKIERSTEQKNGKDVSPAWITFAKVENENAVNITIDKAQYVAAVKAGTQDSKGKYTLNGKAVDAVAVVTYTIGEAKKDTLKFKVTPPILSANDFTGSVTPDPGEETYSVTVTPATAEVEQGAKQSFTAKVTKGNSTEGVTDATVTWTVSGGSGNLSSIDTNGELTVGETEAESTTLTVTATYTPQGGSAVNGTATVTVKAKSTSL